jgi:hypothetical protein
MKEQQRAVQDRRGLRFSFEADAELVLESPPQKIPVRVTELSFRGCFLESSISLKEKQRMRVKIYHADQYFESLAEVMYTRPNGVGLLFGNMEPHFRGVLQNWILTALDSQAKSEHS